MMEKLVLAASATFLLNLIASMQPATQIQPAADVQTPQSPAILTMVSLPGNAQR